MRASTAVFTIISLNYGAFARTLMESVRAVHPDWNRYVLIVDRSDAPSNIGGELFSAVMVEELPLPRKREFLFRYGVMELNTAVKPWMFAHLRDLGHGHVVYLDPDILVVDRLVDIERSLDAGASGVLLPHLTAPIDDGRQPSELDIMRAGAYNLGFLALGDTVAAVRFIDWWKEKLEFLAVSDVERGLFTDQKWMDLVPGMFDGFAILRDAGYDVAYWNLSHRPIRRHGNGWTAADRPLRFFHFSGFDPENPKPFSKHQNRFNLDTIGGARELALEYAGRVMGHDHARFRTHQYAFGSFDEGTPIPDVIRVLYREDAGLRKTAGDDPFANALVFLFEEARGLPAILSAVWLHHRYLQRVFPDPLGSSREGFYAWFVESGAVELGIPRAFVEPVRRALIAYLASEGDACDRGRIDLEALAGGDAQARHRPQSVDLPAASVPRSIRTGSADSAGNQSVPQDALGRDVPAATIHTGRTHRIAADRGSRSSSDASHTQTLGRRGRQSAVLGGVRRTRPAGMVDGRASAVHHRTLLRNNPETARDASFRDAPAHAWQARPQSARHRRRGAAWDRCPQRLWCI
jgi:hypothetical protein